MSENLPARAHSKLNASSSARWMNCPGSVPLGADIPDEPDSPQAIEGTTAHSCLEETLREVEYYSQNFSDEMRDYAADAQAYVHTRMREYPGSELLIETQVDSSSFTAPGNFGTLDIAVMDLFGRLIVMDYKYGKGILVDPEGEDGRGNTQLAYYALGLVKKYKYAFDEVELVVIQPRAQHHSGETIRSFVMPIESMMEHEQRFKAAAEQVRHAEYDYKTGGEQALERYLKAGSWCRFCKAASVCPMTRKRPLREFGGSWNDQRGIEGLPAIQALTPERLGRMLDAADQLELYISKLRQYAYQTLEAGGSAEGYKLVQRRAQRKWKPGVENEIRRWLGADAFHQKMMSPAELEKAFTGPSVAKFVELNTVKESSGLTLAKIGDKRQSVERSCEIIGDDE